MSASLPLADELSAVFARLSGLLLTEETVHTSLGLVARLAHETIPASVGAGVTLVAQSGQKRTTEATDDLIERFDRLQYELDEGPCQLEAVDRRAVLGIAPRRRLTWEIVEHETRDRGGAGHAAACHGRAG